MFSRSQLRVVASVVSCVGNMGREDSEHFL